MVDVDKLVKFYQGKKVFVTGHTGFKGAWLCKLLVFFGAQVTGYALEPEEFFNLYEIANIESSINSNYGDIRDLEKLKETLEKSEAEIVFHLAARPIVRESYENPVYTYDVNIMGTVNVMEAVRKSKTVRSVVNVTTDKVYENKEWQRGYKETDNLDGYDVYANSKSCSELITGSYRRCFFSVINGSMEETGNVDQRKPVAVSTARAGNVIGGGDFGKERIIPDCVRTVLGIGAEKTIIVRNPDSVRPYQHVLEALMAYLQLAMAQFKDVNVQGAYNVGPEDIDCITTAELTEIFCKEWGDGVLWECLNKEKRDKNKHESNLLKLDSSKIQKTLGISNRWDAETAIKMTVEWTKHYKNKDDISKCMDQQIAEYLT